MTEIAQILDDLACRFIINVPIEELASIQRVCFQIEQAHWFYLDFYREENSKLPLFSLKHFSLLFFQHCELLNHWVHDHELAYDKFIKYKTLVPVCGAIILNQNLSKILLVRGWKASAGWGFPKGKINKDESLVVCAIREVHEETGFDIAPYIRHNEYIEKTFNDQRQRLFIIAGIPENISFVTQTRKEIGDIQWHNLIDLDDAQKSRKSRFFLVSPFIKPLKKWIKKFIKAKSLGIRNDANLKVIVNTDASENENANISLPSHSQEYLASNISQEYLASERNISDMESSMKALLGLSFPASPIVSDIPIPHFQPSPSLEQDHRQHLLNLLVAPSKKSPFPKVDSSNASLLASPTLGKVNSKSPTLGKVNSTISPTLGKVNTTVSPTLGKVNSSLTKGDIRPSPLKVETKPPLGPPDKSKFLLDMLVKGKPAEVIPTDDAQSQNSFESSSEDEDDDDDDELQKGPGALLKLLADSKPEPDFSKPYNKPEMHQRSSSSSKEPSEPKIEQDSLNGMDALQGSVDLLRTISNEVLVDYIISSEEHNKQSEYERTAFLKGLLIGRSSSPHGKRSIRSPNDHMDMLHLSTRSFPALSLHSKSASPMAISPKLPVLETIAQIPDSAQFLLEKLTTPVESDKLLEFEQIDKSKSSIVEGDKQSKLLSLLLKGNK